MFGDNLSGNSTQIESLTPAQYRWQDFVRLCCSENENNVCRRLFQSLQQCVECLLSQHMNLIDYVYLVFASHRRETDIFPKLANLVDAVIARAVDLKHIQA